MSDDIDDIVYGGTIYINFIVVQEPVPLYLRQFLKVGCQLNCQLPQICKILCCHRSAPTVRSLLNDKRYLTSVK
jgi:hypothetical protein